MGWPYLFASNKYVAEEVLLLDFQDKVMIEGNRAGVWILSLRTHTFEHWLAMTTLQLPGWRDFMEST